MFGLWVGAASAAMVETLATDSTADFLVIDNQHGAFATDTALSLLRVAAPLRSSHSCLAYVRLSQLSEPETCRFLDAGAHGLIAPMIHTKADAERFVQFAHYPPIGVRSFGPYRQKFHQTGPGFDVHLANAATRLLGMIESKRGLENLDEILSVPHLSGVFVGPNDLGIALGFPPTSAPTGELLRIITDIAARAKRAGKLAGIFCLESRVAAQMRALGFDFVSVSADSTMLMREAKRTLKDARL